MAIRGVKVDHSTIQRWVFKFSKEIERNIKRRIAITTGFKEFESAQRTLAGIEIVNIIRKGQIVNPKNSTFKTFCSLAA